MAFLKIPALRIDGYYYNGFGNFFSMFWGRFGIFDAEKHTLHTHLEKKNPVDGEEWLLKLLNKKAVKLQVFL